MCDVLLKYEDSSLAESMLIIVNISQLFGRVASGVSFAPERVKNSKWRGIEGAAELLTSGGPKGGPIFLYGVSFAPKGPFCSKLGVSKYRTIWLKTAVFPIWPRAKMVDFRPPKNRPFLTPQNPQIPTSTQLSHGSGQLS